MCIENFLFPRSMKRKNECKLGSRRHRTLWSSNGVALFKEPAFEVSFPSLFLIGRGLYLNEGVGFPLHSVWII